MTGVAAAVGKLRAHSEAQNKQARTSIPIGVIPGEPRCIVWTSKREREETEETEKHVDCDVTDAHQRRDVSNGKVLLMVAA